MELKGKYNEAKVFTDNIESEAISQIIELCNQPFSQGSKIRIMPDTHAGAGCTIGTTMTITDKIIPNLVGVDIGCGMLTIKLKNKNLKDEDFQKLDEVIRNHVPSGFDVHKHVNFSKAWQDVVDIIKCPINNRLRILQSIGTLGGGEVIAAIQVNSL